VRRRPLTPAQRRKLLENATPAEFAPPRDTAVSETLRERMDRGIYTPTGWTPPPRLSRDGWLRTGEALLALENFTPWAWGDWWRARGFDFKLPEDWRGPSEHTLENYAAVCKHFETNSLRREAVSFRHHAELASLPRSERNALLDWCEQTKASVSALRAEKQRRAAALLPPKAPPPEEPPLKVPPGGVTPPAPPAAPPEGEVLPPAQTPPLAGETGGMSERDFLARLYRTIRTALDDRRNPRAVLEALASTVRARVAKLAG
jgi:hypothetical protein